mmetsp:Transcript_24498/g.68758  ORF Transcript_24498/g.68758 Transcript_24498/m.68758 type:complete len:225 (+) Transcript_24498:1192-1866(+)
MPMSSWNRFAGGCASCRGCWHQSAVASPACCPGASSRPAWSSLACSDRTPTARVGDARVDSVVPCLPDWLAASDPAALRRSRSFLESENQCARSPPSPRCCPMFCETCHSPRWSHARRTNRHGTIPNPSSRWIGCAVGVSTKSFRGTTPCPSTAPPRVVVWGVCRNAQTWRAPHSLEPTKLAHDVGSILHRLPRCLLRRCCANVRNAFVSCFGGMRWTVYLPTA